MKRLIAAASVAATLVMQPLAAYADCAVFEHIDFGGHYWWLASGDRLIMIDSPYGEDLGCSSSHGASCGYTYYRAGWNDVVSSFEVEPGCEIRMYEHVNEGGAYWFDYESYSYVGDDWNDVVSEVHCYCS